MHVKKQLKKRLTFRSELAKVLGKRAAQELILPRSTGHYNYRDSYMVATSLTHCIGVSIPPLSNTHSDRGVTFGCLQKVLRLRGGAARSFPFYFPLILFNLALLLIRRGFQRDELAWGRGTYRSWPCALLMPLC